jgi:hypothetical protein
MFVLNLGTNYQTVRCYIPDEHPVKFTSLPMKCNSCNSRQHCRQQPAHVLSVSMSSHFLPSCLTARSNELLQFRREAECICVRNGDSHCRVHGASVKMLALIDRCARRTQVGSVYIRRRNKTECSLLYVCVRGCVWYSERKGHNLPYPLYNLPLLVSKRTVTTMTYEATRQYCGAVFHSIRVLVTDSTFSHLTSALHVTSLPERFFPHEIYLRVKRSKESSFPMGKEDGAYSSSSTFKHRVYIPIFHMCTFKYFYIAYNCKIFYKL